MRINAINIILIPLLLCPPSWANEKGDSRVLTDAERARVKSQIEELSKNKLQEGDVARKNIKEDALRKGEAIDQRLKQDKERVDAAADNYSSRFGPGVVNQAGNVKKRELEQKAAADKAAIAGEAAANAAKRQAAAKKSAEDVKSTVEGLKSQVSKDGKYGLKPQGSNLYVRNYGQDKKK